MNSSNNRCALLFTRQPQIVVRRPRATGTSRAGFLAASMNRPVEMPKNGWRDIVVIGGSAGAFEPVKLIGETLDRDLPASVFVILHTTPRERNYIADVLNGGGRLPARQAVEGEAVVPGCIYVPPPDRHLIIAKDHIHISRGPKEGLHRPSINMTFRSAAKSYGTRVIGVLLSGLLDDGASGLWEIARYGGITIVQDPEQAPFPSMPLNALRDVPIDYRVPAEEISSLIRCLVLGEEVVKGGAGSTRTNDNEEKFSGFSCPECRGPLWETQEGPLEFRCRVGHCFSLKTLIDEHTSTQERKLYEAIVALEEGALLSERALDHTSPALHEGLRKEAEQLRHHASALRKLLEERISPALD